MKESVTGRNVFEIEYYRINKLLIKFFCIWPYQKTKRHFIARVSFFLCIQSVILPMVLKFLNEIKSENVQNDVIIENIFGAFMLQVLLINYYITIKSQKKSLYIEITRNWRTMTDNEERDILRTHSEIGQYLCTFYLLYFLFGFIVYVTLPLIWPLLLNYFQPQNITRKMHLCIHVEYYIDQEKYFFHLMFHISVCLLLSILMTTAVHTTYVVCVEHYVGVGHVLIHRLQKFNNIIIGKSFENVKKKHHEIYNYAKECALLHNKIFDSVKLLQDCYGTPILIITGLVLVGLGMGGIVFKALINDRFNLLRLIIIFIGAMLHLFYMCTPSQRLIDVSDEIRQSIYFCPWYMFPIESRYIIQFMLMRCIIPCQLNAGPLMVVNYKNCIQIIKTGLSYFTVVFSIT